MLRGAIIFIVAFLIFLIATIAYPSIPPGKMIYDAVVEAETDYEVLGIPATSLIAAIFNGIIYGIVIWLIYTLAEKSGIIPKGQTKPTAATAA